MLYYLYVNRKATAPMACAASSRLGLKELREHAERTLNFWVITHGRLGSKDCEVIEERSEEKRS